jgi:pyridoxine/pyridoxamine 5'-phosphate oxidase
MRAQKYAVQASVAGEGSPQSAVVGIAVSEAFEIVFDTLGTSRKAANLRGNPRIALVIGGLDGNERTVQYEGVADEPSGADLDRVRELYFQRFPDGRERLAWPGITHFRVRPKWIRYSDFGQNPPLVVEFTFG